MWKQRNPTLHLLYEILLCFALFIHFLPFFSHPRPFFVRSECYLIEKKRRWRKRVISMWDKQRTSRNLPSNNFFDPKIGARIIKIKKRSWFLFCYQTIPFARLFFNLFNDSLLKGNQNQSLNTRKLRLKIV